MGELCAARDNQPDCAKYRGCVSSWRNKLCRRVQRQEECRIEKDFYVLQQMQQTQNKKSKQHRETTRQLIMPFFKESSDPMVDYIKKNLFNVNTPARDALGTNCSIGGQTGVNHVNFF
jgi:hypothetical protein